jgi:hypothetical protein
MARLLILFGLIIFTHGVLKVSGIVKEDVTKDSELDKKMLSEKNRYFIGRYYAGSQAIIAGLGAILLGLILIK